MKITTSMRSAIVAVFISVAAIPVWQQETHSHSHEASVNPAWSELLGSMEKMHIAMSSVKRSGDSNVDFVSLMLPHHQAAIDMAKTQLLYGTDPQMRRLAQEIITDQQSEIDLMQHWLEQRDSLSGTANQKGDSHRRGTVQ